MTNKQPNYLMIRFRAREKATAWTEGTSLIHRLCRDLGDSATLAEEPHLNPRLHGLETTLLPATRDASD